MPRSKQPTATPEGRHGEHDDELGILGLLRALIPERPLTPYETLHVVELLANRFRTLLGVDTVRFPSEGITELPYITVVYEPSAAISALASWSERDQTWVIAINSVESRTRQRYSLCHEFAHIIFHRHRRHLFPHPTTAENLAEAAADHFGACLLMPKRQVHAHYAARIQHPAALAEVFDVSHRAMQVRLHQLGIAPKTVRCGYDPADHLEQPPVAKRTSYLNRPRAGVLP